MSDRIVFKIRIVTKVPNTILFQFSITHLETTVVYLQKR